MKSLNEKLAAERANKARIAAVRKDFRQQYEVGTDAEGNYRAVKTEAGPLSLDQRRRGDAFVRTHGLFSVAPGLWKIEAGGVVYRIFTRASAYGVRTDEGRELGRIAFKGIGRPEAFAKAVLLIADEVEGDN